MMVILLTSAFVLLLTCAAFFIFEFYSFRKSIVQETRILAEMCAANSTAALAFENAEDAKEVLSTLKVNPNIVAAILFNERDSAFAIYPESLEVHKYAINKTLRGFRFSNSDLRGMVPVINHDKQLGYLFVVSDMNAMYDRFRLYALIVFCVIIVSLFFAYLLSRVLQQNISKPILNLASAAKLISANKDYSIRVTKYDNDEVGLLTNSFNEMLSEVQKQNEEINLLNENLEKKVKARTEELELSYTEMEAFSYTVSHDLNAPLRQIDLFISLYLEKSNSTMDEEGRKTFEKVVKNTRKMRQLISDLLAFSQLGRKELTKTEVNMKEMATGIFLDLKKIEEGRIINFQISDIPNAFVDNSTINQVWSNLIGNAVKYSRHAEHAEINVTYEESEREIVYCVKDNGVGFEMEHAGKLFNVFERLHSQQEFEGTGVGLAIVNRILTKHGGKVWANSITGKGATFYFSLPK